MYTELYPSRITERQTLLKTKDAIQAWLKGALNDPIARILIENSHLTRTQIETLLIDVLAENSSSKRLNYDEKAKLRLTKAGISRGAFNRTLRQAKGNVAKSIYTVLLLGYCGVFESTRLDPYLEVANKLHDYLAACKGALSQNTTPEEHTRMLEVLRDELEKTLNQLSNPSESIM